MAKNTVLVGCKLPNGIEIEALGKTVTLKGTNSSEVIGGYGLTEVDTEFWNAWLEGHKEFAPVVADLIFANENQNKTRDEAEEKSKVENGLEGINPKKPGHGVKPHTEKDDE